MPVLSLLWSMAQSFSARHAVFSQAWNLTGLKKGQKWYRCAFQASFPHEPRPKLAWIYTIAVGQPKCENRAQHTPRSPAPLPWCLCISRTDSVWKRWEGCWADPGATSFSVAAAASVSPFPGQSGRRLWEGLVSPEVCPWGGGYPVFPHLTGNWKAGRGSQSLF